MKEEFEVCRLPPDCDLTNITGYLRERNIPHRIFEQGSDQVVIVYDARLVQGVRQFVEAALRGDFKIHAEVREGGSQPISKKLWQGIELAPVTLLSIVLSFLGAALIAVATTDEWVGLLSFQQIIGNEILPVSAGIGAGEWWRLLTPIFLHFGLAHVVFNSVMMWEFGRRLEALLGSLGFVLLIVTTGVFSNLAQYLWMPNAFFGGMSGVVYALIGFIAVYHRLKPSPLTQMRPGVVGFSLFWLVLCTTGAAEVFLDKHIANAAHIGGLLAGALIGWLVAKTLTAKLS